MNETGTAVESAEAFARRVLPVYTAALAGDSFWAAEIAAKVRQVGLLWARSGGDLDVLLDTVNQMAGELMDSALRDHRGLQRRCSVLRRFGDACGRVAVELLWGFRQANQDASASTGLSRSSRDLALALLAGETRQLRSADDRIALGYAVVAVRTKGAPANAVESAFQWCGSPGTLTLLRNGRGYVLIPVHTEQEAARVCERVAVALQPHGVWTAVTWVRSAQVPDGRQTVSDVLALVTTLRLPPGVYRRQDVLLEYAAMRSPGTARAFRRLIEPVMTSDALRETLEALIAEDGNRSRAAERLVIHRSTIDYRLDRIEQLTGQSPGTLPGMRTLTSAYALWSLSEEEPVRDFDFAELGRA
ncbi:PucR family transcriptional regulator [Lentzea rhizosphaerae]|uniref:PucR family transcriptional regulator n=1 Tax=Lentzea rhizosphaerae TaxID=2041025 RepID=A0ABV8C1A5_9PSEU